MMRIAGNLYQPAFAHLHRQATVCRCKQRRLPKKKQCRVHPKRRTYRATVRCKCVPEAQNRPQEHNLLHCVAECAPRPQAPPLRARRTSTICTTREEPHHHAICSWTGNQGHVERRRKQRQTARNATYVAGTGKRIISATRTAASFAPSSSSSSFLFFTFSLAENHKTAFCSTRESAAHV